MMLSSAALFSYGVVADSFNKPLMRTAKTDGAKMGFGSEDDAMHMHSSVDIQDTSQALSLEQDTAAAAQEDLPNRRTLLNVRNLIPEEDTEGSEEDTDDSTKLDAELQALLEVDTGEEDEEDMNLRDDCRRRGRRRRGCGGCRRRGCDNRRRNG